MRTIRTAETLLQELDRAIHVLGSLYRGRSPRSGEPLPAMSEYDDADVVFALGLALGSLEEVRRSREPHAAASSEVPSAKQVH